LSNDPSAVLFRPDASLNREDLIAWKVPLDTRKALPNASIDTLKETWGFQDTAKIDPKLLWFKALENSDFYKYQAIAGGIRA
jgi:hypothetical protein